MALVVAVADPAAAEVASATGAGSRTLRWAAYLTAAALVATSLLPVVDRVLDVWRISPAPSGPPVPGPRGDGFHLAAPEASGPHPDPITSALPRQSVAFACVPLM